MPPVSWTVAFDRKAPTFRHVEYDAYKAQRKGMPPELAMQLPLLKEALEAMNIPILEIDGFEGDDIIGTVAKRAENEGLDTLIITGDRDALQLATKKTKILITKKGISEFELYDEDEIIQKYGFTPQQFIDYKGLMGDPSDNIPGLPGVGEKTAHKLILAFGSINELLANVDKVESEKLRNNIRENAQIALLSRRLAEIETNVPIATDFEAFRVTEPDYDRLIALYKKLEFKSLLKKLESARPTMIPIAAEPGAEVPKLRPSAATRTEPTTIRTKEGMATATGRIKQGSPVAVKVFNDHNHKDYPVIHGISVLSEAGSYYFDGEIEGLAALFRTWLCTADIRIVGHQLQDDYYALFSGDETDERPHTGFDTAIAEYLLNTERSKYELKALTSEYLQRDFLELEDMSESGGQVAFFDDEEPEFAEYGAQWCAAVLDLVDPLSEKLKDEELESVYFDIELPLIFVLASIELQGFSIDRQELLDAGKRLSLQIEEISLRIYALAGQEFNINSPKQLGEILFEKLGLPSGKKNKTGFSTNADILEKLHGHHEIIDLILEFRTLSKLNSTYVEGLLPLIHTDGKIHAHLQQTVTATGRISCTEPNLQNIPIKQELAGCSEKPLFRKAVSIFWSAPIIRRSNFVFSRTCRRILI